MHAVYIDPNSLLFAGDHVEVAQTRAEVHTTLDAQYADVFRQDPLYSPWNVVPALRHLLAGPHFRRATNHP